MLWGCGRIRNVITLTPLTSLRSADPPGVGIDRATVPQ